MNLRKATKILTYLDQPISRAVLMIIFITIFAAIAVALFESQENTQFNSFWDSVWWVIVTISTVGYGDKVPVTGVGKVIAALIMFVGVALLSVVTATVSSVLVTKKLREGKGLQDIKNKNHILLCGWNNQAEQILESFEKENLPETVVLVNQLSEEAIAGVISRFKGMRLKFVYGDFTKENILNRANAKNARAAVLLSDVSNTTQKGSDERAILATLSIKTINHKIKVYAHIQDAEHLPHLREARADEIIVSDSYTGYLMANYVLSPGVPQLVDQIFSSDSAHSIRRNFLPSDLIGKNYSELKTFYAENYKGILIGLGQMTDPFNLSDLMSDDYSYLDDFIMRKFKEAGRGTDSREQIKILVNPPDDTILQKSDFYLAIESEPV